MKLKYFKDENLLDATEFFFMELGIPIKTLSREAIDINDILGKKCEIVQSAHMAYIGDKSFESLEQMIASKYCGLAIFPLDLNRPPARKEIAELTRDVSRKTACPPVCLLLKYTEESKTKISIAISQRTDCKPTRCPSENPGKIVILRDIYTEKPHSGHQRILEDLRRIKVKDVGELHEKWLKVFDVKILTEKFYSELSDWYFMARQEVNVFGDAEKDEDIRNSTNLIRLTIGVIFAWFIKEKGLVPENMFNENNIRKLFESIPLLNDGLFDYLDNDDDTGTAGYVDGFSGNPHKQTTVTKALFFGDEQSVYQNYAYNAKRKTDRNRGLINILNDYKFTITENTSIEEEVALDPELLGKIFENLLASYSHEPRDTARKASGSFYTPRKIVDYMANESLAAYLKDKVGEDWENNKETISAINNIKILDPACGTGAFPMGILHRMVEILQKLDPENSDYAHKLFLIENCIFGVDIQPIAILICKQRFFLSLITEQNIDKSKDNWGISPLLNIETKLVAANALVEQNCPKDRSYRYDRNVKADRFDARSIFGVRDGFDVVIGNPPYLQVAKGTFDEKRFPYSEGKDKGKQNLYKLFVEASYNLAKENTGIATMIVQSSLMCDLSSQYTRELLLTKTEIAEIAEFPKRAKNNDGQIFESALQGTCVYMFKRKIPTNDRRFKVSIDNDITTIGNFQYEELKQDEIIKLYPNGYFIPLVKPNEFRIIEKMQTNASPLKTLIIERRQGDFNLATEKNEISDTKTPVKLLRGKNLRRFYVDYNTDEFMKNNFKQDSVIKNTQNNYLIHQQITGTTDKHRLHFALTDTNENFLCGHSIGKILVNSKLQHFFLGILNSKLLDWYFRKTSTNNNVNGYEIEQLPIPPNSTERQRQLIVDIVKEILSAKKKNPSADTDALERQIDRLTYATYSLSRFEIAVVEGAAVAV